MCKLDFETKENELTCQPCLDRLGPAHFSHSDIGHYVKKSLVITYQLVANKHVADESWCLGLSEIKITQPLIKMFTDTDFDDHGNLIYINHPGMRHYQTSMKEIASIYATIINWVGDDVKLAPVSAVLNI